MRSKFLNRKHIKYLIKNKLLARILVMSGYVVLYYLTRWAVGIEAAERLQGLALLLQRANGG